MRLTGGATYVVGGRVGMGETHQVKIHFNWSNLSSSSSSIPTPYIYILLLPPSGGTLDHYLLLLLAPISFLHLARDRPLLDVQFLQHFSKTAFRNAQFLPWQMKSAFLGSQFLQSFWNALFCTHSFYNTFCEEVSKNNGKTMLFVNAMASNVQKQIVFWFFLANLWNSLCCRAESHKIEKKNVVLSCFLFKIGENRCTVVQNRWKSIQTVELSVFYRKSQEIVILSFTLVAASRY